MTQNVPAAVLDPARRAALRRLNLLDTAAEPSFDRLTGMAMRLLGVPILLITMVDGDRQFFKSCRGLPEPWASRCETPLTHSFCQHVVASGAPLVVGDARAHPLVHDNPAILDLGVIAYAGIPLFTSDRYAVGAFCAIDTLPREWTREDLATLEDFAAIAMHEMHLGEVFLESQRAKDALKISKQRLSLIFESVSDALTLLQIEPEGVYRVLTLNPAAITLTGFTKADWSGKDVREIFPEPVAALMLDTYATAIRTRQPLSYEQGIDFPNGHRVLEISIIPIFDDSGICTHLLGRASDITERKQAESERGDLTAQIEADRALLEAVLQCMPVGVMIAEAPSGRIVLNNSRLSQIWSGVIPPVTLLNDYEQFVGFHHDGRHYTVEELPLVRAITSGEVIQNEEMDLVRHNGTRATLLTSAAPVRDASGAIVAGVAVADDITEIKRAEAERLVVERKLMELQKLESLGVLAGGIAHDFNNLLTVILGNAELALLDLPPGTDAVHEPIERVSSAARRAAELTQLMLAYVGKGQFTLRQVDLNGLIAGMRVLIDTVIARTATLRYDLAGALPTIMADTTLLRQVVMNLATNAAEAIDNAPGTVTLRTGVRRADRAYLADAVLGAELPEDDYVYLEVADTGPGMDAATRARIFDPFFTTKFVGRGLGLAAVLGIVRTHQGALLVESAPHHGTTVMVLFPRMSSARTAPAPARPATTTALPETILVVDDEEEVRRIAVRMLERFGFQVLTAAQGSDGVEMYRSHADDIALVLLDMTMPRMNGVEVFHQIRQINPTARVVLMSGYDEQEATRQFAGEGLAGFLHKPFTLTDLRAKIDQVLNRSG